MVCELPFFAHAVSEWFHLVGLLHDLGKILCLFDEPQWAVVGDIFPVGCRFDERCVLSETFADNPDSKDPVLSTEYGIYAEGCGLDNVHLAWGHDEYMYQVGSTLEKLSSPVPIIPRC